jgi:hypothetical protein
MTELHRACPYVVKFEVLNEPNHQALEGGWGPEADQARDFSRWFLETYNRLKEDCPWASLGFPGLAPHHGGFNEDLSWAEVCRPAVERADWLGVHCYWQNPQPTDRNHLQPDWGLRFKAYQELFPDKIIEITEFGNANGYEGAYRVDRGRIAQEYVEYYRELFKHRYINSAAAFIISCADGPWEEWGFTWRRESGDPYEVVYRVGDMDRPRLVPAVAEAERVIVVIEPPPQEEIARLEKEARDLREQLAASQTTAAWLQQEVQGLRQQAATSQETVIQLRREVDTLRQRLVEATTTTPVSRPPVTPPATPPVTVPRITSPPMEDITTRLPHHPVRSFDSRALEQIQYLVIQHSVLPGGFPAEKIAAYLVEEKHWPGIGYHFYITSDGKIYQTNQLETVCYFAGANVQYNERGVCICFAGDFTAEVPSGAQLRSGGKLLAFLMQELELPIERIMGHKRFVATQSPGQQWDGGRKWKDMLLAEVRAAQA